MTFPPRQQHGHAVLIAPADECFGPSFSLSMSNCDVSDPQDHSVNGSDPDEARVWNQIIVQNEDLRVAQVQLRSGVHCPPANATTACPPAPMQPQLAHNAPTVSPPVISQGRHQHCHLLPCEQSVLSSTAVTTLASGHGAGAQVESEKVGEGSKKRSARSSGTGAKGTSHAQLHCFVAQA
jgi:hypothetical protein